MEVEPQREAGDAGASPAAVIHRHKVALAFVGIGHLVVQETQVDLEERERVCMRTWTHEGETSGHTCLTQDPHRGRLLLADGEETYVGVWQR